MSPELTTLYQEVKASIKALEHQVSPTMVASSLAEVDEYYQFFIEQLPHLPHEQTLLNDVFASCEAYLIQIENRIRQFRTNELALHDKIFRTKSVSEQGKFKLDDGDPLDGRDVLNRPPLMLAALLNHVVAVRLLCQSPLVRQMAVETDVFVWGNTPLLWAIANSCVDAALTLLDPATICDKDLMQQQVNKACKHGNTPLILACAKGASHRDGCAKSARFQREVIHRLLEHDVNVLAQNDQGYSALHFAFMHQDIDLISILLKKGATLDCQTIDGVTPIDMLCNSALKNKSILAKSVAVYTLSYPSTQDFMSSLVKQDIITRQQLQLIELKRCFSPIADKALYLSRLTKDALALNRSQRLSELLSALEAPLASIIDSIANNNHHQLGQSLLATQELLRTASNDSTLHSEPSLFTRVGYALLNLVSLITGAFIIKKMLTPHYFFYHKTDCQLVIDSATEELANIVPSFGMRY